MAVELTVEELVTALQKTNMSTIVVEGSTDAAVLRRLESLVGNCFGATVDLMVCSGRPNLLEVYRRMRSSPQRAPIAFLADSDMWIFSSVPAEYVSLVVTLGYSIETDIIDGSDIERLMELSEKQALEQHVGVLAEWFAFEVAQWRAGGSYECEHHACEIADKSLTRISGSFVRRRGYCAQPPEMVVDLYRRYTTHIPGKRMLEALAHQLSGKKRFAKHSKLGILEISLMTQPHRNVERLVRNLAEALRNRTQLTSHGRADKAG